jgi:hypothetical protein
VQISRMDARLIRVAPECCDTSKLACPYRGALGSEVYLSRRQEEEKARNGSSLSNLCRSCRVASRRWLIGICSSKRWKTTHSFQSHGHYGLPSLLPHHISCIDVVVMRARSSFEVSGAFTVRMVKRPRCLVHHTLSRSWVLKCCFNSLLWSNE